MLFVTSHTGVSAVWPQASQVLWKGIHICCDQQQCADITLHQIRYEDDYVMSDGKCQKSEAIVPQLRFRLGTSKILLASCFILLLAYFPKVKVGLLNHQSCLCPPH
jgi:hypothetical protein